MAMINKEIPEMILQKRMGLLFEVFIGCAPFVVGIGLLWFYYDRIKKSWH
jgi:hypothetical protein